MGCIVSHPSYIASSAGSLKDYQKRYLETKTLGEGEFGVVKLAHDVTEKDLINSTPLAVKYLRKGYQFKDNTIYSPIKKEVMVGEVEILRMLNGECYNLKLVAVYETPSHILILTEYCEGGEMIPYVTQAFKSSSQGQGGLRTEDVSRISYQLLSAVDHCDKHGVIHRDVKPENVMFCSNKRDSELRLIDFGSGTLDGNHSKNLQETDADQHHTFAGSAFYISPEMFQRIYTSKTDVWSAGVTLYVLVAGYPAERLQECFNILQRALTYRPKSRSNAGQLLKGEFVQFHISHGHKGESSLNDNEEDDIEESTDDLPTHTLSRTKSVLLEGSVIRHNTFLGYQSFERTVTAVLATMLPKEQRKQLVTNLWNHQQRNEHESTFDVIDDFKKEEKTGDFGTNPNVVKRTNASSLRVVPIKDLIEIIRELNTEESRGVIKRIQSLEAYTSYDNYAYHISMLRQFVSYSRANRGGDDNTLDESQASEKSIGRISSVHAGNVWSTMKSRKRMQSQYGGDMSVRSQYDLGYCRDCSVRSQPSRGLRRINTAMGP
ncbi:hypothetical protein HJC23_013475 [Cyclotella cryptica]|uniref:Protein kinase domain-containing protein n=1 Tax=Cyclotella cryptica TaxID=29204 RepID=A0ABD3QBC1_9STRA